MTGIRKAIVTARCIQTWCAFGPCFRCGNPAADPAHLAGERLLCGVCCCAPKLFAELPSEAFERSLQPATQEVLF
jgi:hypothetical protein